MTLPNNSEKDGHNSRRGSSRRSSSESSHSRRASLTQRNGAILAATGKCISQVLFNKVQKCISSRIYIALRVHISRVYCSTESLHSRRTSLTQRNGAVLAASGKKYLLRNKLHT